MTDTRTTTQEVQAEILDTVRKSQDAVVDAIKRWADSVQSITPSIPVPNLPYADKLPKPEELVASAYDFAEKMLANQRILRRERAPGHQAADLRQERHHALEGRHLSQVT